ncbi:MAG: ParA family protein [Raineya sp.]|jgi:chromosome partitioning protein|nr:ParA family protein [Raineya sp.]
MTKIISVASLKGGVGKTTTTAILTSIISHEYGLKVTVIDAEPLCVFTQARSKDYYDRGLEIIIRETGKTPQEISRDYTQKDLIKYGKDSYDGGNVSEVLTIPITQGEELINIIKEVRKRGEYRSSKIDILFVDIPGSSDFFVKEIVRNCDGVLVPIVAAPNDLRGTSVFVKQLHQYSMEAKDFIVKAFINKKRGVIEENQIDAFLEHIKLTPFKSYLSNLESFGRFSTIVSFSRHKTTTSKKAKKEAWELTIEFLDSFGLVKKDLSNLEDYMSLGEAEMRKISLHDCIQKFVVESDETSAESLTESI